MSDVTISAFDAATASDAAIAEIHAFFENIYHERLPDDPWMPVGDLANRFRSPRATSVDHRWIARDASGALVGFSHIQWEDTEDNRNLAGFDVQVGADHRRKGLACRLLLAPFDMAEREGRTLLCAQAPEESSGSAFLSAIGATCKIVTRRSRVVLAEVDRALLEGWVAKARERAADYEMLSWVGRTPPELVDDFAALIEVMNTAPREDFEMEDERFTPAMLIDNEERAERNGMAIYTAVARHIPTGELAGFTQAGVTAHAPWQGWQWGTGVWPKHRDRGLGRWLKADVMLRLLERDGLKWVDTWNAQSNDAMLGINVAMGYKPFDTTGEWQVPLATARAAIDAKLPQAALQ